MIQVRSLSLSSAPAPAPDMQADRQACSSSAAASPALIQDAALIMIQKERRRGEAERHEEGKSSLGAQL